MCTMLMLLAVTLLGVGVFGENCDKKGVLVYEDMACTPSYAEDSNCPVKYNCVGIGNETNCVYKGEIVTQGTTANSSDAPLCLWGCYCTGDRFSCPQISCRPELYNYKPTKPGCYLEGSLDKCCHYKERCPPFDESIKCVIDGKTYRDQQDFYPNDACVNCICRKGWRGKYEAPFCQRKRCGVQLRNQEQVQKSCAPAYMKRYFTPDNTLCCPNQWICPKGTEVVEGNGKNGEICNFGDKKLKIGQWINTNIGDGKWAMKFKCECLIPPLLACIEQ